MFLPQSPLPLVNTWIDSSNPSLPTLFGIPLNKNPLLAITNFLHLGHKCFTNKLPFILSQLIHTDLQNIVFDMTPLGFISLNFLNK